MRSIFIDGLKLFTLATLITLTGCATLSPSASSTPSQPAVSWQQRQQQLQNITAWQLRGVIGVQQPDKNDSASINWQQLDAQHYALRLFGPFGAGAVDVQGAPGRVSLESSSQPKPMVAADAESLIAQQTGWNMPVGYLYYWVRGIPAAGVGSRTTLDKQNRLSVLNQAGWEVEYLGYSSVNGIDLPDKLVLTNANFRVKLVIKSWLL